MPGQINWGTPGQTTLSETAENEIFWGAEFPRLILHGGMTLSSAAADAGNTPTTLLRAGLILAEETTGNELSEWDADATDGSQNIYGILTREINTLGFDNTAADQQLEVALRGPVKAGELLIQGTALASHVDEFLARRALHTQGFILDDDPQGYLAGVNTRIARVTGAADTLTEAENGTKIFYSNAASTTVTLPTIHPGLWYDLVREGDEEFVVTSAAGDDIIVGNDLSADSVTFTTASEHIGAWVRVTGVYVSTTVKWQIQIMGVPLGAGLDAWTYSIAT